MDEDEDVPLERGSGLFSISQVSSSGRLFDSDVEEESRCERAESDIYFFIKAR